MAPKVVAAGGKGGKGGRGKTGKSVSKSAKAGLQFPVGRMSRFLKQGKYATRVGAGTPVISKSSRWVSKPSDGLSKSRSSFSRTPHRLLQRPDKRDRRWYYRPPNQTEPNRHYTTTTNAMPFLQHHFLIYFTQCTNVRAKSQITNYNYTSQQHLTRPDRTTT
jgi:hypothetical protein